MKQLDLDGQESSLQPKPKKRAPKTPKAKRARKAVQSWGGGSYGDILPLPSLDGHPITCPCGRVQVYRSTTGKLFFYDKEGALGDSVLRATKTTSECRKGSPLYLDGSDRGLAKTVEWTIQLGCRLHENLSKYRDAHLEGFEAASLVRQTPYR